MSILPPALGRYASIVSLFVQYERGDPDRLVRDLEALGPTYIKLGQVLSTRADLLPPEYLAALTRLQDNVEPFPFAQVQQVVEAELGVRLSKAFSVFEQRPIAAASLGQVHRAALRDGRVVAVKVQRPGIAERVTILAAMIVSAAMVMRVPTSFTLLGYPGLAMILLAFAGSGAAYLAVQIVRHDRTTRPR